MTDLSRKTYLFKQKYSSILMKAKTDDDAIYNILFNARVYFTCISPYQIYICPCTELEFAADGLVHGTMLN